MKGVYQRGKVWWIRYRFEGRLVRKAIGYDERLAEEAITAIRGDIVRGEYRLKKNGDKRLFKEMVTEYLEEKAGKRSLRSDKTNFNTLLPEFQHRLLHEITRRDIELFMRKRRAHVSGATVNRQFALLRHMLNIAVEKGYIDKNPAKGIKRCQEAPWRHKYVFSELEVNQLMAAAAQHLRPILVIAFGTGLRKGDILNLQWRDIDLDRQIITLYMQKTGEPIEIPMLPMVKDVLFRLKSRAADPVYVFVGRWPSRGLNKTMRYKDIKTAFRAAMRRSGLAERGYRFHDIRRTFATMLYNRGVHLTKIQRLLGHKSITTTERYLGVKFEETRQAIQVLDQPLSRALAEPAVCTISAQSGDEPIAIPLLSDGSGNRALPS
jgi:integrase